MNAADFKHFMSWHVKYQKLIRFGELFFFVLFFFCKRRMCIEGLNILEFSTFDWPFQTSRPVMVQQLNAPRQQSGAVAATGMPNMQPLSVTGSKFQYVRLVAAPASQGQATFSGIRTWVMTLKITKITDMVPII